MTVRVVMPREVRRVQATRLMWLMWSRRGYACRPCPRSAARRGWIVLEFWIDVPAAYPEILPSYEWELDDALLSKGIRARFAARGARLEEA